MLIVKRVLVCTTLYVVLTGMFEIMVSCHVHSILLNRI
jgi:hypothetical protein